MADSIATESGPSLVFSIQRIWRRLRRRQA
jgi:hypothetical protein